MTETTAPQPALSISGASCQGCARKIRQALAPMTGDPERIAVDLEHQTVALPPGLDLAEAARRVTDAGYPAQPLADAQPCGQNTPRTTPPASDTTSGPVDTPEPAANDGEPLALAVSGATCASCVPCLCHRMKSRTISTTQQ